MTLPKLKSDPPNIIGIKRERFRAFFQQPISRCERIRARMSDGTSLVDVNGRFLGMSLRECTFYHAARSIMNYVSSPLKRDKRGKLRSDIAGRFGANCDYVNNGISLIVTTTLITPRETRAALRCFYQNIGAKGPALPNRERKMAGRNGGAAAIVREIERVHVTSLWHRSRLVYLGSLFHRCTLKRYLQKARPP